MRALVVVIVLVARVAAADCAETERDARGDCPKRAPQPARAPVEQDPNRSDGRGFDNERLAKSKVPSVAAAERAYQVALRLKDPKDPKDALASWVKAAAMFEKAMADAPEDEKGAVAFAIVMAYQNGLKHDATQPKSGSLNPTEVAYVRALDAYALFVPSDATSSHLVKSARVYQRREMFDESRALYAKLITWREVERSAGLSNAPEAAAAIIDGLVKQKKPDLLLEWVAKFRKISLLVSEKFPTVAAKVDEAQVSAMRLRAEATEASAKTPADFKLCAKQYLEISDAFPKYKFSDELLYNAGVCFERAGAKPEAIAAFERVPTTSSLAERVKQKLAALKKP